MKLIVLVAMASLLAGCDCGHQAPQSQADEAKYQAALAANARYQASLPKPVPPPQPVSGSLPIWSGQVSVLRDVDTGMEYLVVVTASSVAITPRLGTVRPLPAEAKP